MKRYNEDDTGSLGFITTGEYCKANEPHMFSGVIFHCGCHWKPGESERGERRGGRDCVVVRTKKTGRCKSNAGLPLARNGNDFRGHCCESQLDDGEDEHPDRYIINIRLYLRERTSFIEIR